MDKRTAFHEELTSQFVYETSGLRECNDIIIVVHDQLDYVRKCIESLYKHTKDFKLYLWDNNSLSPTAEYLKEVAHSNDNVVLARHDKNIGFILPNNLMASRGNSPYITLLNSDTEVSAGWDTALKGWLTLHPHCKQVGYEGGLLEADAKGSGKFWGGSWIDYLSGWCFTIHRNTYEKFGLFDDVNLKFAYCEDSDLSLRLKEAGHEIYAMHIRLVKHYGNATVKEVAKVTDTSASFLSNHQYMRDLWKEYLGTKRCLLKPLY